MFCVVHTISRALRFFATTRLSTGGSLLVSLFCSARLCACVCSTVGGFPADLRQATPIEYLENEGGALCLHSPPDPPPEALAKERGKVIVFSCMELLKASTIRGFEKSSTNGTRPKKFH